MDKILKNIVIIIFFSMALMVSAFAADRPVIYIDAGHGGVDGGAAQGNLKEKDFNLKIAGETVTYLKSQGFIVRKAWETDGYKDWDGKYSQVHSQTRGKWIRDAAMENGDTKYHVISIHNNSSASATTRGQQTYYYNSKDFASSVHAKLLESLAPHYPQGYKKPWKEPLQEGHNVTAALSINEKAYWDNLTKKLKEKNKNIKKEENLWGKWIPESPQATGAALVETAFMTNPDDLALLQKDEFIKAAAHDIGRGVLNYENIPEMLPPVKPRACYTPIQVTTTWKQTICPNTLQAREVEKAGTHTIFIPTECPQTPDPVYGGVGGGGGSIIVGGGGGGGQGGGGGIAGTAPTPIATETCFAPGCIIKAFMPDTESCSASSVIMANGTYEFSASDLSIPARGMGIDWSRSYRSNRILKSSGNWVFGEPADGPMGFGWMNDYLSRIEGDTYIDGDGAYNVFTKDASGNYLTDMENGLILKKTTTGYELIEIGGRTLTFNTSGKLLSIKDTNGNTVTLNYDASRKLSSIMDAANRQALTFAYNSSQKISYVTDLAGRTVNYEYDGYGNLIRVTDHASRVTRYEYNSSHGITSKANALGETVTVSYKYPDKGIVEKVIDPTGTELIKQGSQPTGHVQTYAYDFKNSTFYVIDFNGVQKKKITNEKGQLLLEEEVQTGAEPKLLRKIEYLPNRVEKHTDSVGNVTTMQRDEWRNVVKVTDGEGNITAMSYNTNKKPLTVTDPLGNVTRMDYDAKGNLSTLTQAQGKLEQTVTTYGYNGYGEVTSVTRGAASTIITYHPVWGQPETITDALNNTTTIEYDNHGNADAVIDPENHRTEFTYDSKSNLLTKKDPIGNITTYTYNADNRPATVRDALNRVITLETDYKGRVTAVIDALANRKEYGYDGNGNLAKIMQGDSITTLTYDGSNRLKTVIDPENNTTAYEYASSAANCSSCSGSTDSPVKITDPSGNFTRYVYDKANRLSSAIDPMGNVSLLGRDATGRVKTRTDANGNITTYEYDSLGRVKKQTDANNGITTFTYDQYGNLKTLADPKGNTTTFDYDLSGRMTKETRPMGQVTEYTYYKTGLLKTVKDAKAQVTTYTYDIANRLKEITYADGKKDSFTYDNVGNMLTYTKDSVSSTITYDNLNRKLSETVNYGPFSKTYSYTYDSRSNKATYTSPEGTIYTYTYNKNNQPTSIVFGEKTIGLEYQWNRLTKTTLPNGNTTDYTYNQNSWLSYILTKQGTTSQLDKQYEFDKVGNIDKITDNSSLVTDYSYDTTYQLTGAASPSLTEAFTYDKAGNRLTSQQDTQPAVSYSHNANNEMTGAGVVTYTFDSNGNTTQKTEGGQITKYIYNTANRLERVELPGGGIAAYTYDPFGRRIKKDVNGYVTYYLYADEGLVGEYDSAGNLQKSYGWIPDSIWGTNPVFMQQNGANYYYHNDHLGTPQKMTDEAGNVVWSATYTAFGEATIDDALVTNNLRFPGQYFDAETGKHYNLNRYYDPKTSRYTQVDPIGFSAGDVNLYRYVGNNPVNSLDPFGLYDVDVHLGMTYIWAKQSGFTQEQALAIAEADQGVDEKWDTTWGNPFGGTQMHFRTREDALSAINKAVENKDLRAVGMALHMLQDTYSHAGYKWYKGGHAIDSKFRGKNPDTYCRDNKRDDDMRRATKKYLKRFLGELNNYYSRQSIYSIRR